MLKLLMIIHTNTYLSGLLPLAVAVKRGRQFEPLLFFARNYPTLLSDIDKCRNEAITVLLGEAVTLVLDTDSIPGRYQTSKKEEFGVGGLEKFKVLLRSVLLVTRQVHNWFPAGNVASEIRQLSRQITALRAVIQKERVSLVILPADNRYDQAAYVKAAHLEGTGVVIVPQFMASPLEWAEHVWNQRAYHVGGLMNRLAILLYPRWAYRYRGRKLIALPGAQVIARELLGIAPRLPWVLHSGSADSLALESKAVRNYCSAEGLPPEKMVVTGSIAHDVLCDSLADMQGKRAKLCRDLGFQEDRRLILSALPPDMGRPECDFRAYTDLVRFWCQSLSSVEGYNHVVVLHPSVRYDDIKYIEDYGLKIAHRPTATVIPLCDIYVASISSTIQWAIACGKPVLNYDVFRYRYTDYQNVGGVLTVEEQQDFLATLQKLTSDTDYYALITSRQANCAEYWGRLDGKAGERLLELFASTIELYAGEMQSP